MRPLLGLGLALGLAMLIPLTGQPASSGFPASQGRLVYVAEAFPFGTNVFVMNADGRRVRELELGPTGLNGGVAASPRGTAIAYTSTVNILPPNLPPAIRRRLPKFPPSTLGFGDFTPLSASGSSIVSSFGSLFSAYGRPAWSPTGRSVAFATGTRGRLHIGVLRVGS